MASLEKIVGNENREPVPRALYDRRAGNDRRSICNPGCDKTERRYHSERRQIMEEKRFGWVRDTKYSSIYLEALR